MIRIVTESMSDFTQEEAKAADLIVMPLPIRFGMEEYWDDGVSLTQDDFYARLRVAKELPKTSQVPVEHYRKCFNRLLENPEDEVLVITGSSKLSGCYQSACIAREACHWLMMVLPQTASNSATFSPGRLRRLGLSSAAR